MKTKATAPGKLAVFGEFGIMEGGPVLITAINQYVLVRLEDRIDDQSTTIDADLLGITKIKLPTEDKSGYLPLFSATANCIKGYLESRNIPFPQCNLSIEMEGVDEGAFEMGLGFGSAACVAMSAAYFARVGIPTDSPASRWDLLAMTAYARSQALGGSASGADVAASVYGGLLTYRKGGACSRYAFPEGLYWRAVHRPGKKLTGSLMLPLSQAQSDQDGHRVLVLVELAKLATETNQALDRGDVPAFLEGIRGYNDAIARLQEQAQANLVPAVFKRLCAVAAAQGGALKPVSVEQGELGMVFAPDEATLESVLNECSREGLRILDVLVDNSGVRAQVITP